MQGLEQTPIPSRMRLDSISLSRHAAVCRNRSGALLLSAAVVVV
jgi:hypothetical protein